MELIPLKSPRLEPGHDLFTSVRNALEAAGQSLREKDVLIVASKVVSYSENRLTEGDLEAMVRQDADRVFGDGPMALTLKNGVLIPNAGIDQSNAPLGKMILWPEDPFRSARALRAAFKLTDFGVVITDSTVRPLRRGVTGIAIGWAGFTGVADKRGAADLYGRKLKYTQIAVADQLATAAELVMGQADESIPFVIARGAPVVFTDRAASSDDYRISPKECLYRALLKKDVWKD